MLYRNTKIKVRFPDEDADYFDIVAGDTLTPYLFIICLDTLTPYLFIICLEYVLRTSIDIMKDNGFKLAKERKYPAQTITNADYIALLANTPFQAETLLHSMERASGGISLHVNAHKTEYMRFSRRGDISTLNGSFRRLVDKFTYFGYSISSNEKDINTRLPKAWTAID